MKKSLLATLLACCLGWALPGLAQDSQLSEAEYQAKLEELQSTIQELEEELSGVRDDRGDLLQQLESNESKIGELQQKIDRIKAELDSEEQALQELKQQRQQLVQEQRSQKKHIAQQVRAAYRLGGQSNVKLLLNQDDPQQVSRMLKYYDYFLNARTDKLAGYIETIDQLNRVEPQIINKTQNLARNREQLLARQAQLQEAQQQRQQTLARLETTIANKDLALRKAQDDRKAMESLLSRLDAVTTTTTDRERFARGDQPFAQLRGKLPWPTEGQLSQKFGSSRIAGKMRWNGVVIAAEEGSPVRAIHHGRVVFADYLRGQGLLLILDHGDGYMSLYGHNQSLNQKVGRWVEAGEVIAHVGSSGGQSQAGLYFEIRQAGKPADPSRWCG